MTTDHRPPTTGYGPPHIRCAVCVKCMGGSFHAVQPFAQDEASVRMRAEASHAFGDVGWLSHNDELLERMMFKHPLTTSQLLDPISRPDEASLVQA